MNVVRAIEVCHVGAAIERTAIGRGEKYAVKTRVGQRRSKPAERGLIDTVCRDDTELTNRLAVEARLVERTAVHEADANERHTGIGRAERCNENKNDQTQGRQQCRPAMPHDALL